MSRPRYITNFGKIKKHNQPKKKVVSISEDTHEELQHLAKQSGQSLSFLADFALRTFVNNCSTEFLQKNEEYQRALEETNANFQSDFKMKTPPNVVQLPKVVSTR